jgi:stage V sporulation protein R
MKRLPPYLMDLKQIIESHARGYGLDFFETRFEMLDYKRMNEVASYGGFPVRYPHWRFGMDFERMIKSHTYGLSHIYEMVINNDPCYAYLLEGNSLVDQKLVMCHVLAHNDFFKNNYYFSVTNRKMVDEMANHATRIRRFMDRFGVEPVEQFVDICLSIENLIDPQGQYIRRSQTERATAVGSAGAKAQEEEEEAAAEAGRSGPQSGIPRLTSTKPYLDEYINPPEFLESQRERWQKKRQERARFPAAPERDVYRFLLRHAPLKRWQRSVMEIVLAEAEYFLPQRMTKIMNEGWATYWHSKLMTQRVLEASEVVDYAKVTAGVTASPPGRFNPYKMGLELFRHIEQRWDKGQFGKEWEECDDLALKETWDRATGQGRDKIFQVRRIYNDVTFVNEFFTEDFCREHMYYTFGFNNRRDRWEIESRAFAQIKQRLLFSLANSGNPVIDVLDANHQNRGELLLKHRHEGMDLRKDYAQEVLQNLYKIWTRPVYLLTYVGDRETLVGFDGTEHQEKAVA